MSQALLLILDTETGGLNRNKDGICQTVAILYDPADNSRQILMNARSKPRSPMAQAAINVHKVTNEMCRYHPSDNVVMQQLQMLINSLVAELAAEGIQLIFSGYNSEKFDMPFMDCVLGEEYFKKFSHIDVMRLAKKLFPHLPNHKLATVYEDLIGSKATGAHDAAFDCLMVADILHHIGSKQNVDWLTWADDMSQPFVLAVMTHGEHKGKPFSELPLSYLQWVVQNFDKNDDCRHTALVEMKKRGAIA